MDQDYIDNWFNSWHFNNNIPILDLQYKNRINYSYIDFLEWQDVPCPVMKGYYHNGLYMRPFLVVKVIISGKKSVEVFFKRYPDNNHLWMGCGYLTNMFIETIGGMTLEQFKLVSDIIENRSPILKNYHKVLDNNLIGKKVELFSQIKENASNKIRENWLRCRYNPEYKMCEKVQTNNFKNIGVKF